MTATANPSPLAALAGQYLLRPGQQHSVEGLRPVLQAGTLARLLQGKTGEVAVRLLGSLFTLCAHAHQRTAALALNAACLQIGAPLAPLTVAPLPLLRLETARDHLRSMALDWPQRLTLGAPQSKALLALAACPVMRTDPRQLTAVQASELLGALPGWLQASGLVDPDNALLFLNDWSALAKGLRPVFHELDVLHPDAGEQAARLRELAQAMLANPDFAQQPVWRGQCVETGAWTRLRHRAAPLAAEPSVWWRLSARWQELTDIAHAAALPEGALHDPLLSSGALALGAGAAIAWCEMARGLLLHWVQVDASGAVLDYRVLAPTEWNFHPQGALAQALSALQADDVRAAQCLAAAFDACVDCRIDGSTKESSCA